MDKKPSYAELEKRILELEQAEHACRLAESALRISEKKYRALFENAVEGIFQTTPDGKFIAANPSLLKILGFASFHELCTHFNNIRQQHYLNPEDRDKFRQLIDTRGAVMDFETRLIKKDGTPIWACLNDRGVKDDQGNILYFEGFVEDITQRKQAQHTMRLVHYGVNHSRDAIFWLDTETRLIYVNDAACRSLGYSREELLSMTESDIDPDFSMPAWADHLAGLRQKAAIIHESRHRTKDGRTFPVEITGNYVMFEGREGSFAFARDITGRKQAEAEQKKLQAQLLRAQKMESIGTLAGGIAHDFNNMLGVIRGHSEIALKKIDRTSPLFRHLEQIDTAAGRSTDIIRQLLAFARKQPIRPKMIDLNQLVEGMLKMLGRIMGKNIQLIWKPARPLPPVNMDPGQIDQILVNLCVNARNAIWNGGTITIETIVKVFDPAFCTRHPEFIAGEFVALTVTDNGCGVDKKILPHIFDPFFTTKKIGQGTGLGLAMVYGIVKQNDGFITVHSEPGQGTTFAIHLPCRTGTPEKNLTPKTGNMPVGVKETILVVEDDDLILEMIQTLLENLNYTVLSAPSSEQALSLARAHTDRIHLLITDVVLPGMNGQNLAEQIKERIPGIQVLFMSGYTSNVIVHPGKPDQTLNFIQKPFSVADIAHKIRDILERNV